MLGGQGSSTMHTAKPSGGFGDVLRRYRTDRGLTQEELAERAGLSARGVQDLERGLRLAPQAVTIRRLADALGLEDVERVRLLRAVDRTRSSGRLRPDLAAEASTGTHEQNTDWPLVGRTEELSFISELLR